MSGVVKCRDLGLILSRDSLNAFGCKPLSTMNMLSTVDTTYVPYNAKTLIYFIYF
jgi:hypothetical protein